MEWWMLAGGNGAVIVAMYMYIQKREDRTIDRTRERMDALESDIKELRSDMTDTKTNYNAKFLEVHNKLNDVKNEIIQKMTDHEQNIRDSNHRTNEETHKALLKVSDDTSQALTTVKISLENLRARMPKQRRRRII